MSNVIEHADGFLIMVGIGCAAWLAMWAWRKLPTPIMLLLVLAVFALIIVNWR